MYTPPQWRTAAAPVALVLLVCAAALTYGVAAASAPLTGWAGGVLFGMVGSMGWALRRLFPPIAAGLFALAAAGLGGLWLAGAPGAALALVVGGLVWAVWALGYDLVFTGRVQRERLSTISRFGQANAGPRALIVFHSTRGGFQRHLQTGLAEDLAERGWRVDLTTASRTAPKDASAYDILVLGAPAYNGAPARAVVDYVRSLAGLPAKGFVLLVTGGGMTGAAMRGLRRAVAGQAGPVVEAVEIWARAQNRPRFAASTPREIVRGLADSLAARVKAA
jgi:hypothetical protein